MALIIAAQKGNTEASVAIFNIVCTTWSYVVAVLTAVSISAAASCIVFVTTCSKLFECVALPNEQLYAYPYKWLHASCPNNPNAMVILVHVPVLDELDLCPSKPRIY